MASEELGHLDLQDDRHLALVDDAPGLEGVGDDLEEALARAAGLGVDVALELADVLEAPAHGVHLVAVGLPVRLQLAQHPVLVDAHDHDPQAAQPGPLDPAPVGALVGEVVGAPGGHLGIAARVVRRLGCAVVEEVLRGRRGALRALDGRAVGQREGNAVLMPRAAAVEVAAQVLERHPVHVALDDAADPPVRHGAGPGRTGGVQLRLGIDRATGGRDEPHPGEHRSRSGGGGQRERSAGGLLLDAPVGRRARLLVGTDAATAVRGQEGGVRAIEQVAAERGRLHPQALPAGDDLSGRALERVAPVGEGIARGAAGGPRRRVRSRDESERDHGRPCQPTPDTPHPESDGNTRPGAARRPGRQLDSTWVKADRLHQLIPRETLRSPLSGSAVDCLRVGRSGSRRTKS